MICMAQIVGGETKKKFLRVYDSIKEKQSSRYFLNHVPYTTTKLKGDIRYLSTERKKEKVRFRSETVEALL